MWVYYDRQTWCETLICALRESLAGGHCRWIFPPKCLTASLRRLQTSHHYTDSGYGIYCEMLPSLSPLTLFLSHSLSPSLSSPRSLTYSLQFCFLHTSLNIKQNALVHCAWFIFLLLVLKSPWKIIYIHL